MCSGTALPQPPCSLCSPSWPTTCATPHWPISASTRQNRPSSALADSQVELHTDRNQTLAQVQGALASDDGRSVLRGSVALDFRTTDRVVILNLPGQAQYQFKLRLAANPSHSDQFGPWHLVDRVTTVNTADAAHSGPNDAFAIRYRVL